MLPAFEAEDGGVKAGEIVFRVGAMAAARS